jgi:hypothetical protein
VKRHGRRPLAIAAAVLVAAMAAAVLTANQSGSPKVRRASIDELWRDPGNIASRDLRLGRGGRALQPARDAEFEFKGSDTTGYSGGYDVVDAQGRKWDVKIGDEGQTEVMASRLLWAIGFHQPVVYFVPEWTMKNGPVSRPSSGRFRLASDHDSDGEWSWTDNPFLGARPFKGLIVANLIINNWDLKPSQNRIYTEVRNPSRWFVVQDLGA